jgi:predicted lysophospholipase L1 biosynthesis ABC-type transport system permease subunit
MGSFAQATFARLAASYFDIDITPIWPVVAMIKGVAVGLATSLLFALPSLLSITEVKPAWILRQEVSDESRPPRDRRGVIAALAVLVGLWAIAIWVGSSVRFATWFAGILLASLLILAAAGAILLRLVRRFSAQGISSVAGTRYRRMREVAILKTVGATKGTLVRMFCTEFALIGSAAGLIGGTLGVLASAILVGQLLDTTYNFTWMPVVITAIVTAALTIVTGWLASYGVLNQKPLEILRRIES